jgi:hypothetical protein
MAFAEAATFPLFPVGRVLFGPGLRSLKPMAKKMDK